MNTADLIWANGELVPWEDAKVHVLTHALHYGTGVFEGIRAYETDQGPASLADLFQGRSQLLIYHFMFGPDYTAGCPACSAIADGFNGFAAHLANHDVMLWAVSRAPFEKLQAYKRRMGWSFPWASSFGSDFNSDFDVYASEEQQRTGAYEYNYQPGTPVVAFATRLTPDGPAKGAAMTGTDVATYVREKPGMSAFATRQPTGGVATTSTTSAERRPGCRGVAADREQLTISVRSAHTGNRKRGTSL